MAMRDVCKNSDHFSSTLELLDRCTPPVLPTIRTFLLNFIQFGLNFMVILLSIVVVPAQVERLVMASNKGTAMGGLIALGAAVTVLVCPIVGMLSDRSMCRVGKRRPMILIATAFLCIGLLGMALSAPDISLHGNPMDKVSSLSTSYISNATVDAIAALKLGVSGQEFHCDVNLEARRCHQYQSSKSHVPAQALPSYETGNVASHAQGVVLPRFSNYKPQDEAPVGHIGLYVGFFMIVVVSQAAIAIPYISLVADKTHPSQRGFNSGVMGAMVLLGSVTGATVGISFTHIGVLFMYALIIIVMVVCVLVTTFSVSEDAEMCPPPISCKLFVYGFVKPFRDHDFRWVFATRFLMQQGVSTITGFLEYWLNDVIPLPFCWSAATSVSLLLLPLLLAAAVSSMVLGVVSDRTGRRKIIVALAAFIMGIGSFVNAFISGKYAYFIAALVAFIIGFGYGAFQSVDFALMLDILTDTADTAKDIAVWHQSLVLPQAIASPLGGIILDYFEKVNCKLALGYTVLFILASAYFLLSAIFVFRIHRVR